MSWLIKKKSGKPFPPPFNGDGKTAVAINIVTNTLDPKQREAYLLENGKWVNCCCCKIISETI